jgi:RNA polymerase sigma-70 factor (ECF subfamily)
MDPQPDRSADSEDRALIERWLRGDQRAATALVERHANAIARFVGTLGEQERDEPSDGGQRPSLWRTWR